jgi:hypothetical protein
LKPCANWPLESFELGLIIGFFFSADRHLSVLITATTYHSLTAVRLSETALFKRCCSYQTHHREVFIEMKRRATLPALSDGSVACPRRILA